MDFVSPSSAAIDVAYEQVSLIHAVSQPEHNCIHLEDGSACWLKRYRFRPLRNAERIRLLRILPRETHLRATGGAVVPRCELVHVKLDSAIHYAAISYAWGDLEHHHSVIIHEKFYLNVTSSLYEFLCTVGSDLPLYFWVDQLCINQHDLVERSSQVQLMCRIFEQAVKTFCWLGIGDGSSKAAFDLIERLAHQEFTQNNINPLALKDRKADLEQDLLSHGIHVSENLPAWNAIDDLTRKPWFSRLWTLQEVVVARTPVFVCGSHQCSLWKLLRASLITRKLLESHNSGAGTLLFIDSSRARYNSKNPFHLIDLLLQSGDHDYQCTHLHDRIYAVLALQGKGRQCNIHVDYNQTTEKLYIETAKEIIKTSGNLELLARRSSGSSKNLPSWVPDWEYGEELYPIGKKSGQFTSSKSLPHLWEASSFQSLITRGKIVAKITKINPLWVNGPSGLAELAEEFERELDGMSIDTKRDKYIKWLLTTTLTIGHFGEQYTYSRFSDEQAETSLDLSEVIHKYNSTYWESTEPLIGRSLAIFDEFPIGLVPKIAYPGDLLCILHGSAVPILPRRNKETFQVVGSCFVHGLMYGEAVDWLEGDKLILT